MPRINGSRRFNDSDAAALNAGFTEAGRRDARGKALTAGFQDAMLKKKKKPSLFSEESMSNAKKILGVGSAGLKAGVRAGRGY